MLIRNRIVICCCSLFLTVVNFYFKSVIPIVQCNENSGKAKFQKLATEVIFDTSFTKSQ